MTLISFRGFSLVAVSLLPLESSNTLVYGSGNGGRNVEFHTEIGPKREEIAQKFNLKSLVIKSSLEGLRNR